MLVRGVAGNTRRDFDEVKGCTQLSEICSRTDRQTDIRIDRLITTHRSFTGGEVIIGDESVRKIIINDTIIFS